MKGRNLQAAGVLSMNRRQGCAAAISGRPGGHNQTKAAKAKSRRQEGKRDIRAYPVHYETKHSCARA